MLTIFINLLLAVHILVCVLIVIAVLMQRPKNEGLGAAFGGGMTDSLFGAQTSNVLASVTRWLGVIFFALTLVLSALYARQGRTATGVQQKLQESAKAIPTPVVPAVGEGNVVPATPADMPKAEAPVQKSAEPDSAKEKAPSGEAKPESKEAPVAPEVPKLKISEPQLKPAPLPGPAAPGPTEPAPEKEQSKSPGSGQ